jgi:hypothetical protein
MSKSFANTMINVTVLPLAFLSGPQVSSALVMQSLYIGHMTLQGHSGGSMRMQLDRSTQPCLRS